uniref:Mediator of RNA polymerase II transcription subunit 24 n=1 Tax=Heterorhabditis bacteriophora TaxID=37862 RepID=A0A1I7XS59_HETBA
MLVIGRHYSISSPKMEFLENNEMQGTSKRLKPHLESAVPLDSSASTGINGNPKAPNPVNTPRAEKLSSQNSNWATDKWSFLLNCIEQINQLTTVAFGSNRLTWLKEFIKQHTLHIPPDAQKDFFGVSAWLCRGCCWLSRVYP